jgi:hypothetical protein
VLGEQDLHLFHPFFSRVFSHSFFACVRNWTSVFRRKRSNGASEIDEQHERDEHPAIEGTIQRDKRKEPVKGLFHEQVSCMNKASPLARRLGVAQLGMAASAGGNCC